MKRKNIYIILLLSMFALTSCKVGKSYVRPEMALPDSLAQQQDSMSIADEQWQAVYTDSTLRALIDRALEYNKDMLIAASRVKEMAAQKRISVANLLPQLTGKVEAEREVENYGGHSRDVGNTYEAKALLSWELDLWGNLRWKKVAAVAEYLQSVEAQRALRMTIVAEVAQAYYELVALDTELEIVRQTQKAREEGVRLARIRFEGGLTSETSYQQAQVELARTATLVPDLERRISLKENDISFLVGEFPTRIKRVNFLQELDVPESLPVGLPSDLLERRPDVRVAEQQLRAEHARVKVAYTNMFPRLALTGQFGLESDVLSNFLESPYSRQVQALYRHGQRCRRQTHLRRDTGNHEHQPRRYQEARGCAPGEPSDLPSPRRGGHAARARGTRHRARDSPGAHGDEDHLRLTIFDSKEKRGSSHAYTYA